MTDKKLSKKEKEQAEKGCVSILVFFSIIALIWVWVGFKWAATAFLLRIILGWYKNKYFKSSKNK